ncbi:hypothetical protein GW626_17560 [Peribacillus muralis]|nr:hypothetical protein [Peribacillus muralis]MCK1992162.1 hypothetical protein [Peribacillus muralis]MCK2012718.1 hypothetical protein [Peribacillus muralis]
MDAGTWSILGMFGGLLSLLRYVNFKSKERDTELKERIEQLEKKIKDAN